MLFFFIGGLIKYIIDPGYVIPLHACVFCFRFLHLCTKICFLLVLGTTCSSMQEDRASHEYVLMLQWSVAFNVFYTPQPKAPVMSFNFKTYVQDNIHGECVLLQRFSKWLAVCLTSYWRDVESSFGARLVYLGGSADSFGGNDSVYWRCLSWLLADK